MVDRFEWLQFEGGLVMFGAGDQHAEQDALRGSFFGRSLLFDDIAEALLPPGSYGRLVEESDRFFREQVRGIGIDFAGTAEQSFITGKLEQAG